MKRPNQSLDPASEYRQKSWREAPEAHVVRAAKLGDERAFAEIVDRHGPAMLQYAKRLCRDEHMAADAVQEAFVSAWKSIHSFENRSSIKTWLFRLVHRRTTDLIRVRRPIPIDDQLMLSVERATEGLPAEEVLASDLLSALREALAELPWNQRAVWLLREIDGLSYDQIAAVLSMTTQSVRGNLHRARRNLTERMARWR